jgi:serine protease Do
MLILVGPAHAGSLAAPDGQHWLTVASTRDVDTAIGIASMYAGAKARVVSSQSGWFAVIMGPFVEADVAAVLKAHSDIGEVPKDALLSPGDKYVEVVWEEKAEDASPLLATYELNKPAQFSSGPLNFVVSMGGSEEDPGATTAAGTESGKTLFSFSTPKDYSIFGSDAGLLKLDPATAAPQLVFTRYTGGAHCCTQTWVATAPAGAAGWTLVDAGILDGGGYFFKDIDGDGALELTAVDNSFLYAFDSYAGSFAPIRIYQLRGNALNDVSNAPEFRNHLKRDLARMEFAAKLDANQWRSNGFLAGWVAARQRLGQGEEAWQTAMENLNGESDFGPMICKTGKPIEQCAHDDLERVPVAKALAEFLAERDYGELPPKARALLN